MQQSIELIAIDLDDTLLMDDLSISPRASRAIDLARDRGVRVTLATGRGYPSAKPYADQLQIDTPLIVMMGSSIVDSRSGEPIRSWTIPIDLAREVIGYVRAQGLYIQAYQSFEHYYDLKGWQSQMYLQNAGSPGAYVADLKSWLHFEPMKLLCIDSPARVLELQDDLRAKFGDKLFIATSKDYMLEIVNPQANKGVALRALAEDLRIDRRAVMAIGDSHNDMPMIRWAGLSVVVENGRPELLAAADHVVPGNQFDGVAIAIEKFVLGEGAQ